MFFNRKKRLDRTHEFRKQQLRRVEKNLQNSEPAERKKKQHITALVLVSASLLIALYTFFLSPIFKIKEVIVANESGISSLDEQLVHNAFQYLLNKNIFLNSARSISEYGISALPRIKDVHVSMVYPETVKISVQEKPIVLRLPTKDQFALVNEDGVVVKLDTATDDSMLKTFIQIDQDHQLDTFYVNQQLFLSDQVDYILAGKQKITDKTGFTITEATWYPDRKEIHYKVDKGFSIWLDTNLTVDTQVSKLVDIYPQIQSSKQATTYIDLRIPERVVWGKK